MLPRWFKAVFAVIMLAACGIVGYFAIASEQLTAQKADVTQKLETSIQRERKQQFELEEVQRQLPLVQSELDGTLPQAQAAQEQEAQLRAQRKALRESIAALKEKPLLPDDPLSPLQSIQAELLRMDEAMQSAQQQLQEMLPEIDTLQSLLSQREPIR